MMRSHPTAYTYAVALRPEATWTVENLTNLRALCLEHGVTEGELLMIEQDPIREHERMFKDGTR